MSRIRKSSKTSQEIPTAALPDIIFILIFFFMVVTEKRENEPSVNISLPDLTEIQKLEHRDELLIVYIGPPKNVTMFGEEDRVQVNDAFIDINGLGAKIEQKREELGKKREKLKIYFKIDDDAKFGVVSDVQEVLRDHDANVVFYSGREVDVLQ